jgi:hypothetical protein
VLEELRGINEIVTAKVTPQEPQEVEAFRGWLVAVAQAAADAAKEGASWGSAERVSTGEKQMLEQVHVFTVSTERLRLHLGGGEGSHPATLLQPLP